MSCSGHGADPSIRQSPAERREGRARSVITLSGLAPSPNQASRWPDGPRRSNMCPAWAEKSCRAAHRSRSGSAATSSENVALSTRRTCPGLSLMRIRLVCNLVKRVISKADVNDKY